MAQIFKAPKKKRTVKNKSVSREPLNLLIESLDHKGMGVARHEGRVVFVDGGLPGEQCEVVVTEQKDRFFQARVNRVITASEYRREAFCPHFSDCGGCQTQYAEANAMLRFKQQAVDYLVSQKLPEAAKSKLPWEMPLAEEERAYRRKTRVSVDARNRDKLVLGFRRTQSKQVVGVKQCGVLAPELQPLIAPVQDLLASMRTPSAISHVNLVKGDNLIQACFRHTKRLGDVDKKAVTEFGLNMGCQVVLEGNQGGFEYLTEQDNKIHYFADEKTKIQFEPNDFIQVNHVINQRMVKQAIDWLEVNENDSLLDLFCGVGNFSLPIARVCKEVIGVEGVAKMVQQAAQNAQLNGIENAQFLHADLNDETAFEKKHFSTVNKVLLDPAREGASGIIGLLKSIAASHILYVSCNPSTFARDAEHIVQQNYRLEKIGLMDMFPNTAHTELMALFVRS